MNIKPHIVIIGAGPAGTLAGAALATDYKVSIVDAKNTVQPKFKLGESLPAAAQRILKELDLWRNFSEQKHHYISQKQSRWGSEELTVQDAFINPEGPDFLLNRSKFEHHLLQQVIRRGVRFHNTSYQSANYNGDHWVLSLTDGQSLSADWVIDASGRRASFARKAGAKRIHHDRLVAHWQLGQSSGEQQGSYIQSTPDGWWYTAAIPGKLRIIAYFCDAGSKSLSYQETPHLAPLLEDDEFSPNTPVRTTAAHSMTLSQCQGLRWHAIGDASAGFDPLSSQGMFHALYTGIRSPQVINGGTDDYQRHIDSIFSVYQQHCSVYYTAEKRWLERQFWHKRQATQKLSYQ